MKSYISIEIPEGELENIFKEIRQARETIYKCYNRLINLEVVTIKSPPAATDGNSRITLEEFEQLYNEMWATHSNRDTP